jgi:hypothetical protein
MSNGKHDLLKTRTNRFHGNIKEVLPSCVCVLYLLFGNNNKLRFYLGFPEQNTEVCLDLPSVSKAIGGRKHLNRKSVVSRIDNKTGGYLRETILFDVEMGRIRKKSAY